MSNILLLENFDKLPGASLVKEPVVRALFGGMGRTTVWKAVKTGKIPQPVKIGSAKFWRVSELRAALNSLSAA
jgi:predicted DNA-binding transcriptional regulator AlpA